MFHAIIDHKGTKLRCRKKKHKEKTESLVQGINRGKLEVAIVFVCLCAFASELWAFFFLLFPFLPFSTRSLCWCVNCTLSVHCTSLLLLVRSNLSLSLSPFLSFLLSFFPSPFRTFLCRLSASEPSFTQWQSASACFKWHLKIKTYHTWIHSIDLFYCKI